MLYCEPTRTILCGGMAAWPLHASFAMQHLHSLYHSNFKHTPSAHIAGPAL
jgi:hypothetical protein